MKLPKLVLAIAGLALVAAPSASFAQGNIFITGHDVDDHSNASYFRAGLDYLAFGAAATPAQALTRSSFTVAYLADFNAGTPDIAAAGYTGVTFVQIGSLGWESSLSAGGFDALVIGTGGDYISSTSSALLNSFAAGATSFATYFNGGGSLFVNSEQGLGQSFYNFVPSFGVASTSSISDVGAFTPTAAGLAIGLTNAIVDMDITHTTFSGVSGSFTIFETYDPTGAAVAIGLRNAVIDTGGGGFVPGGAIPEPSTYGMIGAAVLVGAAMLRRRKATRA